jgi:hypothetical protein
MPTSTDSLDAPVWGAEAIAREAGLYRINPKTGKPEVHVRKAFHLLEIGAIAAKRVRGRGKDRGQWVSTPRLIRNSLLPESI